MLILHTGKHEKNPMRIQSMWQINSKERQTDLHKLVMYGQGCGAGSLNVP